MTIQNTLLNSQEFAISSLNDTYTFQGAIFVEEDLELFEIISGVESPLALNVDYTINVGRAEEEYPTITDIGGLSIGNTLKVVRAPEIKQPYDLVNFGPLNVEAIERGLDRVTVVGQWLLGKMGLLQTAEESAAEAAASALSASAQVDLAAAQVDLAEAQVDLAEAQAISAGNSALAASSTVSQSMLNPGTKVSRYNISGSNDNFTLDFADYHQNGELYAETGIVASGNKKWVCTHTANYTLTLNNITAGFLEIVTDFRVIFVFKDFLDNVLFSESLSFPTEISGGFTNVNEDGRSISARLGSGWSLELDIYVDPVTVTSYDYITGEISIVQHPVGTGEMNLNTFLDVDDTGIQNGEVLAWNSGNTQYEPMPSSALTGPQGPPGDPGEITDIDAIQESSSRVFVNHTQRLYTSLGIEFIHVVQESATTDEFTLYLGVPLVDGMAFRVKWPTTNQGNAYLNVDSLGNVKILMLGKHCPAGFLSTTDRLRYTAAIDDPGNPGNNIAAFEVIGRKSPFLCGAILTMSSTVWVAKPSAWGRVQFDGISYYGDGANYLQPSADGDRIEVIKPFTSSGAQASVYLRTATGDPAIVAAFTMRRTGNNWGQYWLRIMTGHDHRQVTVSQSSVHYQGFATTDYLEAWVYASAASYLDLYQEYSHLFIGIEEWS